MKQKENSLWEKYKREKEKSNELIKDEWHPQRIESMEDNELLEGYKKFGWKDIYAYSNILVPIVLELTKRSSAEQTKLTERKEGIKDVGLIKSYLQANNIDSSHPATQAVQRLLETEFKGFINEKKKYVRKLNKVTDDLYNDKFKDRISTIAYINKWRRALTVLFTDRKKLYEKLYGNIIETVYEKNATGQKLKKVKLLSEEVLKNKYSNNQISRAEYNFAKTYRSIIGELANFQGKEDMATGGYIPAVAMTRMEKLSHRGLLGLMGSSHTENEALFDVKIKWNGQMTPFKYIEDFYKLQAPNNFKNIKDYTLIRVKTIKLLKEGKNEDGSEIKMSTVSAVTALGSGMLHRFTDDQFQMADDFTSMDLNKAAYDYIHSSLFTNGNDKFKGFMKLQALVDGLLIHNQQKGFKNQHKFAREVYKEGFLKNRTHTESGTDKVIKALVKGNLMYVLGYKALAMQKGVYAVGNLMVGKYHTVKNAGGKVWIEGEKRFWQTSNGSFTSRKAVGVLENMNFMDWNVYDDVNMDRQQGIGKIFTDLALSPMIASENWIQGVHFLGLLTEEQWNKFDDNGNYKPGVEKISNQEITQLENLVQNAHGKGYTPTSQRLVQQYSWGQMMLQFSRFIPTMFYDRFAKEDVDIYGRTHVGSLRLVGHVVSQIFSGQMSPKEYVAYRNKLSPEKRAILDSGLRGMAITAVAIFAGQSLDINTLNEMTGDANYLINTDKLEWKIMPSAVRTIYNMMIGS